MRMPLSNCSIVQAVRGTTKLYIGCVGVASVRHLFTDKDTDRVILQRQICAVQFGREKNVPLMQSVVWRACMRWLTVSESRMSDLAPYAE